MATIVISEFMDADAVALLAETHEVAYDPELHERVDDLASSVASADALIVRNRTQVDGRLIDAAPNLAVVGRLGVGLDNIDVGACRDRGIAVIPANGANANAVAEYVIGAVLMLSRGLFRATARVVAGEWPRESFVGTEVAGKTLGCVGFGATARRVAGLAQGLAMNTIAFDPLIDPADRVWGDTTPVELDALAETADFVSIHVPLTPQTRNLIDGAFMDKMKSSAVVINAARGGIVDEVALVAALKRGELGGAAVDVFEQEPVTAASGARWTGVPNVILTPHVAGVTVESNGAIGSFIAREVLTVLERRGR